MSNDFWDLVRQGDRNATGELLKNLEPALRAAVRRQLKKMGRDGQDMTDDAVQSVFRQIIEKNKLNACFEGPKEFEGLLWKMGHDKAVDHVREKGGRGDIRKDWQFPEKNSAGEPWELVCAVTPVPEAVETDEALQVLLQRLTPQSRKIWRWRREGKTWPSIASELGQPGAADAIGKRFHREIADVFNAL